MVQSRRHILLIWVNAKMSNKEDSGGSMFYIQEPKNTEICLKKVEYINKLMFTHLKATKRLFI